MSIKIHQSDLILVTQSSIHPTADMWMHDTLYECCKANYNWRMNDCMKEGNTPTQSPGPPLYYPDWSRSSCINDGHEPEYMNSRPDLWMHNTLDECCRTNFGYILSTCLGFSSTGSTKWYMNFRTWKCVQDCDGASPCGGYANSWDIMYESKEKCCREREWWDASECQE